jgi:hypothetical protein
MNSVEVDNYQKLFDVIFANELSVKVFDGMLLHGVNCEDGYEEINDIINVEIQNITTDFWINTLNVFVYLNAHGSKLFIVSLVKCLLSDPLKMSSPLGDFIDNYLHRSCIEIDKSIYLFTGEQLSMLLVYFSRKDVITISGYENLCLRMSKVLVEKFRNDEW